MERELNPAAQELELRLVVAERELRPAERELRPVERELSRVAAEPKLEAVVIR